MYRLHGKIKGPTDGRAVDDNGFGLGDDLRNERAGPCFMGKYSQQREVMSSRRASSKSLHLQCRVPNFGHVAILVSLNRAEYELFFRF